MNGKMVFILLLLLSLSLNQTGCGRSNQTKAREGVSKIEQPTATANSTNKSKHPCEELKDTKIKGDNIVVERGAVLISNGELNTEASAWLWDKLEVKKGMTFDLMGKFGYLARVCAVEKVEDADKEWKVAVVPGSENPNFKELDKGDFLEVFIIYPSKPERSKVSLKAQSPDEIKKVVNELPEKDRHWALSSLIPDSKNHNAESTYTDLDGDGKIDLVEVNVPCSGKPDDDLTCSKVFRLLNGQWKQIDFLTPA